MIEELWRQVKLDPLTRTEYDDLQFENIEKMNNPRAQSGVNVMNKKPLVVSRSSKSTHPQSV